MPSKYSKGSQNEVEKEMKRYKKGEAHSGAKLKPVKSREQAIAIGLSKARKKGDAVPKKKKSKTTKSSKVSPKKKAPKKAKKNK